MQKEPNSSAKFIMLVFRFSCRFLLQWLTMIYISAVAVRLVQQYNGLLQDCSISSMLTIEKPQSCIKSLSRSLNPRVDRGVGNGLWTYQRVSIKLSQVQHISYVTFVLTPWYCDGDLVMFLSLTASHQWGLMEICVLNCWKNSTEMFCEVDP